MSSPTNTAREGYGPFAVLRRAKNVRRHILALTWRRAQSCKRPGLGARALPPILGSVSFGDCGAGSDWLAKDLRRCVLE